MSAHIVRRTFALAALVATAALLLAGGTDHRSTVFSLDVPNNLQASPLHPGQTLCQGPIEATAGFTSMQLWALPPRGLAVWIRSARGRRPGRPAGDDALTGRMTFSFGMQPVIAGTRFSVCIRDAGRAPVAIQGGPPSRTAGELTVAGQHDQYAAAMVFVRAHGPSLLSLLPTVFARASLWKLGWVGAWTFWLLLAGILVAVVVAAAAVAEAVRCDEDAETG